MRLRFDDCVFDSDTRELVRAGRPVPLPPKVFQLLEALIAERPRALSKAVLHERLWPGTFVTDSNLASLVADLRVAVGDDGKKPHIIRTVQRFGYAFQAEASPEEVAVRPLADGGAALRSGSPHVTNLAMEASEHLRPHLTAVPLPAVALGAPPPGRRRGLARLAGALVLLALGLAGGILLDRRLRRADPPSFRQLTFRSGFVGTARFAPGGHSIVYSTEWWRRPIEIFTQPLTSLDARPFREDAVLLSVSAGGELALSLNPRSGVKHWMDPGTLARMSLSGVGAPRELLEDVYWADWSPDGRELAAVRKGGEPWTLEYPVGKVLVRHVGGFLSHPRVSRRGDLVAYVDHPMMSDDRGSIAVVDRMGGIRKLTSEYQSIWGVAWSADGSEVWFTGARGGPNRILYGVDLTGKQRTVSAATGSLRLEDVSPSGRALIVRDDVRVRTFAGVAGSEGETDVAWLDASVPRAISRDGATMLFVEAGEAGGPGYATYLRRTDGSPAVRLGEGDASDLSPDGKWALAISRAPDSQTLYLYPTGTGESRSLRLEGLHVKAASFFPDGERILVSASAPGRETRMYVVHALGGPPRPISPEGFEAVPGAAVSPDGSLAAAWNLRESRLVLYPLDGRPPIPLPGVGAGHEHCGWSSDGRALFLAESYRVPRRVDRYEWKTGSRSRWDELSGRESGGFVQNVRITPDGRSYVYSYTRFQGDLFLVEGLR